MILLYNVSSCLYLFINERGKLETLTSLPVTFCYIIICEVILRSAVTLLWHSTTNQKSKQLSARSLFCKERKSCPHLNSCKSANQLNFHRTIALICLEEKNKMEKVSKIDMFSMRSLDETNYS